MNIKNTVIALIISTVAAMALFGIDSRLRKTTPSTPFRQIPSVYNPLACENLKSQLLYHGEDNTDTPLQVAALEGDLNRIEFLVSRGAPILYARDEQHDKTPLYYATACGHTDIVKYILERVAQHLRSSDTFLRDYISAPLIAAPNAEIAGLLIQYGADTGLSKLVEPPLLHFAGAYDGEASSTVPFDREAIELLILHGADINARDDNSKSVLTMAASKYHETNSPDDLENARWLMKNGASPNLSDAILLNDTELVNEILVSSAHNKMDFDVNTIAFAITTPSQDVKNTLMKNMGRKEDWDLYFLLYITMRLHEKIILKDLYHEPNQNYILFRNPPILPGKKTHIFHALIDNDIEFLKRQIPIIQKNDKQRCSKILFSFLMYSAMDSRDEMTRIVIENACDKPTHTSNALLFAVIGGAERIARHLLDSGANPNVDHPESLPGLLLPNINSSHAQPIHYASHNGDIPMMKLLIKNGANVNAVDFAGKTPLLYAVTNRRVAAAKYLFDRGANPFATEDLGRSAIHNASEIDTSIPMLDLLFSHGADIEALDENGSTPLLYAVANRHINTVRYLLNRGANVNATDSRMKTALHYAAENGDPEMARLLLSAGAAIEIHQKDRSTPLMLAACLENPLINEDDRHAVVELLVRAGADVRGKYAKGITPLHCAAKLGRTDDLALFLDAGEDINVTTAYGKTPLHFAVIYGYYKTAKALADRGANLTPRDARGRTPMDYAEYPLQADAARALAEKSLPVDLKTAMLMSDRQYILDAFKRDKTRSQNVSIYTTFSSAQLIRLIITNGSKFEVSDESASDIEKRLADIGTSVGDCSVIPEIAARLVISGAKKPHKPIMASKPICKCAIGQRDISLLRRNIGKVDNKTKYDFLYDTLFTSDKAVAEVVLNSGFDISKLSRDDRDSLKSYAKSVDAPDMKDLFRRHGLLNESPKKEKHR